MTSSHPRIFTFSFLFFIFISGLPITFAQTEAEINTEDLLNQGIELFENERFREAREKFEQLVSLDPENSHYHHWLGKSYGRIAENAPWLTAMSMAKKTRRAFEKAVELDGKNLSALRDLKSYYEEAPGFLGGSKKKASEIQRKIEELTPTTTNSL